MQNEPYGHILLTDDFEGATARLAEAWPTVRFFSVGAEEFLVEHAQEATRKAYLTDEGIKAVVLWARRFTPIAQNKLLKLLEEPPPGTVFVLMTPSKASLLPTIRSRLPIKQDPERVIERIEPEPMERFDLRRLYELIQTHRRSDAKTVKRLIEKMGLGLVGRKGARLDAELLRAFEESIRLLDAGSPPVFVLTRLGVKLTERLK